MTYKSAFYKLLASFFAFTLTIGFAMAQSSDDSPENDIEKLSIDGPYVFRLPGGGLRVITVDAEKNIKDTTYSNIPEDLTFHVAAHDGSYPFDVSLHDFDRPEWNLPKSSKMFVMSDPHGRMDCFANVLIANKVIDRDLNWSFGRGHLVIIGDIFDRGDDATQIFWLVYKLEEEAAKAGGRLTFMLGNHETLVLMDDLRYTRDKYKVLAKELGMTYPALWSPDTELGRWLCTRNAMTKVGKSLFVHAGLSQSLLDRQLAIPEINTDITRGLYKKKAERKEVSEQVYFLFSNDGPIWYRGLVRDEEKYNPATSEQLDNILKFYDADRLFVGHTIFDDISTFYGKKVIAVNVDNKENMDAGRGRALLVKGKKMYVAGDGGIQRKL